MPYDGRSPILVAETEQRVLIELQRPALGELKDARALGAAKQLLEIKSLKREQIALRGALEARGVRCATSSPTTACGTGSRRRSRRATSRA